MTTMSPGVKDAVGLDVGVDVPVRGGDAVMVLVAGGVPLSDTVALDVPVTVLLGVPLADREAEAGTDRDTERVTDCVRVPVWEVDMVAVGVALGVSVIEGVVVGTGDAPYDSDGVVVCVGVVEGVGVTTGDVQLPGTKNCDG
jgi:hypothetical protein